MQNSPPYTHIQCSRATFVMICQSGLGMTRSTITQNTSKQEFPLCLSAVTSFVSLRQKPEQAEREGKSGVICISFKDLKPLSKFYFRIYLATSLAPSL